jgi:hypothetical protein
MDETIEIWVSRKEALERAIAQGIKWAESELDVERAESDRFEQGQLAECLQALRALGDFARAAFEFFHDGAVQLPDAYPSHYVYRTLLNQVAIDLNLLQKAIFQRRAAVGGGRTEQAMTLRLADSLALNAFSPALEHGFVGDSTVVTHLARDFDIRQVPYYDVALIGIPYTTYEVQGKPTLDYLAIPHEVGHFLFERGRNPKDGAALEKTLPTNIGRRKGVWRLNWLEELFADAYGCLVAGPVAALSFQSFLKESRATDLRKDDGEHPIPILRPLIQTMMLRKIPDAQAKPVYAVAPGLLDEAWLQGFGTSAFSGTYKLQGLGPELTGQEILDALEDDIDAIFEALAGLTPIDPSAVWTGDLQEGVQLYELERQFADRRYPVEEQGYYRFKARLAGFRAQSPQVEDLVRLVLFEDWETEHGLGDRER